MTMTTLAYSSFDFSWRESDVKDNDMIRINLGIWNDEKKVKPWAGNAS